MRYDAELRLLTDLFKRAGSSVTIVDPTGPVAQYLDSQIHLPGLTEQEDLSAPLQAYLPELLPDTVYTISDRLFLKYTYLILPEVTPTALLTIGPYLEKEVSEQEILELTESLDMSPSQERFLQKYYTSLPVISPESHMQLLLSLFYERLWGPGGFTLRPHGP